MDDPSVNSKIEENDDENNSLKKMETDFENIGNYLQKCRKLRSRKATYWMYPTHSETEVALTALENLISFQEDLANDVKQTYELLLMARDNKWKYVKNNMLIACVEFDAAECKYLQKDSVVSMLNKPPSVELANFDVWKECAMLQMRNDIDESAVHDPGGGSDEADFVNEFLPSQIAKQFCSIYDVDWSEAYNQVKLHFDDEKEEEEIIKEISTIIKFVVEFMKEKVKIQIENMVTAMARVVTEPIKQKPTKMSKSRCSIKDDVDCQHVNKAVLPHARMTVRNTADFTLPILMKECTGNNFPRKLKDYLALEKVTSLITNCAKLSWHLNSLDQPMVLLWPIEIPKENLFQYFRYFTKFGIELDHGVWPALLLCKGGPIMVKGVAQLK